MNRVTTTALLFALVASATSAFADGTTPEQLRSAAEQAVRAQYADAGSRVVIVPTKLSERLRLAACSKPLQTHLPNRQGTPSRVAVAISCTGTPGWTIQVPVQMQVFRQVLVTSRPLARGDMIGPADVHVEERDITRMGYGYVESVDQITGHAVAHPLIGGVVLEPGDLAGRETVHSGEEVSLIAQVDGIEVRTAAMALDAGDTGSHLRVRNDTSGKIINGIVLGAGEVQALP
ncbi:flagellar basal body P-ring formation protein FlgA [Dyella dinghuensis]|uniref:Flagella basal body P-ring formation protein FlgA n=1 Tax=Dyella dinghuensis TaxID=1920169 RepID=A0A3S0RS34_9GAMM|nr:flagellar basal body P-ring formation chaperone FlgA [Dyella dinghuensis]RUL63005.1 flagellar basal body P-ring formation protein FlgA [Dyella dinghuensis]